MMFMQRTVKWLNIIFLLEHQVCFFNSRISKTVWAHSETSNITKNIAFFALRCDLLIDVFNFLQCIFLTMFQKITKHRANDIHRPPLLTSTAWDLNYWARPPPNDLFPEKINVSRSSFAINYRKL